MKNFSIVEQRDLLECVTNIEKELCKSKSQLDKDFIKIELSIIKDLLKKSYSNVIIKNNDEFHTMKTFDSKKILDSYFECFSNFFKYDIYTLTKKTKKFEILFHRQIFCYVCSHALQGIVSLKEIGIYVLRDHTALVHSRKVIKKMLETKNDIYINAVFSCISEIKSKKLFLGKLEQISKEYIENKNK